MVSLIYAIKNAQINLFYNCLIAQSLFLWIACIDLSFHFLAFIWVIFYLANLSGEINWKLQGQPLKKTLHKNDNAKCNNILIRYLKCIMIILRYLISMLLHSALSFLCRVLFKGCPCSFQLISSERLAR